MLKKCCNSIINLFYPRICSVCNRVLQQQEQAICMNCLLELPRTKYFSTKENPVADLFWGKIPFEHASAYFFFKKFNKYAEILHDIKYYGNKEAAIFLGKMAGMEMQKQNNLHVDCIIPIPLHPQKQKKRGYNQSELIAQGMALALGCPVFNDCLIRHTNTSTQTKKSKQDRWDNVKDSFSLSHTEKIKHKHVLLVDDVVTTGATLEACALQLLKVEGLKVSLVSLAMAR